MPSVECAESEIPATKFELRNPLHEFVLFCGFSSSGRAPPCQGGGSEFEPRNPLQRLLHKRQPFFCSVVSERHLAKCESRRNKRFCYRVRACDPLQKAFQKIWRAFFLCATLPSVKCQIRDLPVEFEPVIRSKGCCISDSLFLSASAAFPSVKCQIRDLPVEFERRNPLQRLLHKRQPFFCSVVSECHLVKWEICRNNRFCYQVRACDPLQKAFHIIWRAFLLCAALPSVKFAKTNVSATEFEP